MALKVSTRKDWGCPSASVQALPVPTGWAIHWPGQANARFSSHSQCLSQVRSWDTQHRNRGSRMLEYGGLVCQHGYYIEGRGTWGNLVIRPGSNGTTWSNERYASLQFMVGTNDSPVTEQELGWLHEVVARGRAQDSRLREVKGHRDFYATSCPGDHLYRNLGVISSGTGKPSEPPTTTPPAAGKPPYPFPYPSDHYFGPPPASGYKDSSKVHNGKSDPVAYEHVQVVRARMRERGWTLVAADGFYNGPPPPESPCAYGFSEEVCKFQRAVMKTSGDGYLGPKTWAALWELPVT